LLFIFLYFELLFIAISLVIGGMLNFVFVEWVMVFSSIIVIMNANFLWWVKIWGVGFLGVD